MIYQLLIIKYNNHKVKKILKENQNLKKKFNIIHKKYIRIKILKLMKYKLNKNRK